MMLAGMKPLNTDKSLLKTHKQRRSNGKFSLQLLAAV